ncbi:MAG: diacylglycerol kinase [Burkholderiales bacterium]|nr:diacylglycerol kinase [Burkholderiales bacterium]
MDQPSPPIPTHPHKQRTGLNRLWHALGYSLAGLRAAWGEKAFRQEACLAIVLVPLSFWVGADWVQTALLAGSVVLVLVTELLNSAVEAAIDRIGTELHPLSKRAKDLGSAAVLLALLWCGGVWAAALGFKFLS